MSLPDVTPRGRYLLEREQFLPRPREEVFPFFADAGNLELITPPFLNFQIVTPRPIAMQPGTLIDYRLQLFGIPFGWRTEITSFESPLRFTDTQVSGPYAVWNHTHEFHDAPGGTRMVDRVEYDISYWIFGTIAHWLFVQRTLEQIFDYRRDKVAELLR